MARSLDGSLSAAIESFLRARWDLKPNTLRTYRMALARFSKQHDTLREVTAENVDDYLASIADHKTMARNDCIALRQFSQWATKSRIFPLDPLEAVALPRGHGTKRKPYSPEDVAAIIADASDTKMGIRNRAIVLTMISTGLRPAECWSLQLHDINLADGFLRVRPETTKSAAGERVIPLDPQCVAALDEYVNDERHSKKDALWINNHGDAFRFGGFMEIWHDIRDRLKAQGIDVKAYRCRHTAITDWLVEGVPPTIAQQMAGHKSFTTTQTYVGRTATKDLLRFRSSFSQRYGRVAS
jgi:integrase/recombinase XerC